MQQILTAESVYLKALEKNKFFTGLLSPENISEIGKRDICQFIITLVLTIWARTNSSFDMVHFNATGNIKPALITTKLQPQENMIV